MVGLRTTFASTCSHVSNTASYFCSLMRSSTCLQQTHQDRDHEEQHNESQVQLDLTYAQWRQDPPQRTQRRIRRRIDPFGNDEKGTTRAPIARENLDPVNDQPSNEDDEKDQNDEIEELTDHIHKQDSTDNFLEGP